MYDEVSEMGEIMGGGKLPAWHSVWASLEWGIKS